jgi:hypothetical protein
LKYGTSAFLIVQYHLANVPANTISEKADTKNNSQKNPTILINLKYSTFAGG